MGCYHFASLAVISEVSLPNRVLCQTFGFCYSDIWEKAMAPHSSTLAWKIPWMEVPGRLQTTWSLRVRHDWTTSLSLFTFMHWRRKWQPTPVFLPGESQGWRSLVGFSIWEIVSQGNCNSFALSNRLVFFSLSLKFCCFMRTFLDEVFLLIILFVFLWGFWIWGL